MREEAPPVRRNLLGGRGDLVDVVLEREGDDIRRQAVNDGTRLCAGTAMRLLDRDRVAGLLAPIGGKGLVIGAIELARRIIGNVKEGDVGRLGGSPQHHGQAGAEGERSKSGMPDHDVLRS